MPAPTVWCFRCDKSKIQTEYLTQDPPWLCAISFFPFSLFLSLSFQLFDRTFQRCQCLWKRGSAQPNAECFICRFFRGVVEKGRRSQADLKSLDELFGEAL